jgi:hypothetical protein
MEKEIKIVPPEGYEIDTKKSTFEKIVFKEVKTKLDYIEDILPYLIEKYKDFCDMNWGVLGVSSKNQLESILALNKLCNVAKYLNGDWLPSEKRGWGGWCIVLINSKFDGTFFSITQLYLKNTFSQCSVVYFKTEDLAKQAISILGEEEIRKALTLNH